MTEAYRNYPRRSATTRRFSVGLPKSFRSVLTPDGPAVFFLRAANGDDPVNQLLRLNPLTGAETVLVDPYALAVDESQITAEERAQRERLREQSSGVTAYDMNADGTRIVFTLGGELFTTEAPFTHVTARGVRAAFDPRIARDGQRVAFHHHNGVTVMAYDTGALTQVCAGDDVISYGRAEFIAAEEMGRSRGLWWLSDSTTLLVCKVDETPVQIWHISEPARPMMASRPVRYPACGTANAVVTLLTVDVLTGTATPVQLDDSGPYIARVHVGLDETIIFCQSRDQRVGSVYRLQTPTAAATRITTVTGEPWVELIPGAPRWHAGSLISVEDRMTDGQWARQVCVDGEPISPPTLYVRDLIAVTDTDVVVHASNGDATVIAPYVLPRDGSMHAQKLPFPGTVDEGVHHLVAPTDNAGWWVHSHTGMTNTKSTYRATSTRADSVNACAITVTAADPGFSPNVTFLTLGAKHLNAALIMPDGIQPGERVPVLLDPYGGPHAQRVLRHAGMYLTSAWFAAEGFAVLIIDGQGTPGRNPAFEYAVKNNFALTLDDQIDGLFAAAALEPRLDLDRVAIRGWSFGGYLAALAVLRRPDVFHAAIAGAPVTYWQWYDTHYTERYLGDPELNQAAYVASNLITADVTLESAAPWDLTTPPQLLLIHGLADDNVVAAHTLALSSALLAANRPHQVLPLSGVTHMTPQEQIAEALLLQQARFLHVALSRLATTSDADR